MLPIKPTSKRPIDNTEPDLQLMFIPAADDPDYREPSYQHDLHRIEQALKAQGFEVQTRVDLQKSDIGGSWLTGEFFVHLSALVTPLGAFFGCWITAKFGRKIRFKVGDIEIEAATVKQVEQLLERAKEIKAKNEKQS